MSKSFYFTLLDYYSKLDIPKEYEELSKIDKYINWYLADSTNNFISSISRILGSTNIIKPSNIIISFEIGDINIIGLYD